MVQLRNFGLLVYSRSSDASLYWIDILLDDYIEVPAITNTAPHPLRAQELGDPVVANKYPAPGLFDVLFPQRRPNCFIQYNNSGALNIRQKDVRVQLVKISKNNDGILSSVESGLIDPTPGTIIWDNQSVFYEGWICNGLIFYGNGNTILIADQDPSQPQVGRYLPMWYNGISGIAAGVNKSAIKGSIDCVAGPPKSTCLASFLGGMMDQDQQTVSTVLTYPPFNMKIADAQALVAEGWAREAKRRAGRNVPAAIGSGSNCVLVCSENNVTTLQDKIFVSTTTIMIPKPQT